MLMKVNNMYYIREQILAGEEWIYEQNRKYMKDVFMNTVGSGTHDIAFYIYDHPNQAPEWVVELCRQYICEWSADAKSFDPNKPSVKTLEKIAEYYRGGI
jgi:hypothetical protein